MSSTSSELQTPNYRSPEMQTDAFQSPELLAENEFSYRPIPVLAPITLVIGLLSVIALASQIGLAIPFAGLVLGILARRQISRARGEFGGGRIALCGVVLSAIFLVAGSSIHAYTYATEVPEGFERLSFRWLSQQKPIVEDGRTRIAPEAKELDGAKVFVKGYMYPEKQQKNLRRFVLCKDTGQCCFGGNPAITDMIVVEFVNSTRAQFRELQLVSVAGTFRAKKIEDETGKLSALYSIEGEYFK